MEPHQRLKPDVEKYRRYVDHFDISEKDKVELIHTVWRIMESFVDRAFGLDPVQQQRLLASAANSNDADDGLESKAPAAADAFERSANPSEEKDE